MIARIWHGYTTPANADEYQQLLRTTILPGIHRVAGYRGGYLLRRPSGGEVEFITITLWESLEAIRQFAGEAYETAVVPEQARRLLSRFDQKSAHYDAGCHDIHNILNISTLEPLIPLAGSRVRHSVGVVPQANRESGFWLSVSAPRLLWPKKPHWRERFAGAAREASEPGPKPTKAQVPDLPSKREAGPAKAVEGVGDEAYWVGNRLAGALYVRGGDAFIRLSVGGKGGEQEKLQRSKRLARRILKRLRPSSG